MNSVLEEIVDALEEISEAVVNGWSDDRTLKEVWGWNFPALTRHDLAEVPRLLAEKIRRAEVSDLDSEVADSVSNAARQIGLLKTDTIPNLYNGNGWQAASAFLATIGWLQEVLEKTIYWQAINDPSQMPAKLAKRIRAINARLAEATPDLEELTTKVKTINDAADAADALPTDLEDLGRARTQIESISTNVTATSGKIEQRQKEVEAMLDGMKLKAGEAEKIVAQCSEAYRVTTSIGLAGAFDQRARGLGRSMWVWVGFLLVSLAIAAYIGTQRVELLTKALGDSTPNWAVISIHIVLSVVSVGAPIWFAWLATKQIGQRFRLAEDYGFKASVAKAYEGYRREAARIDPEFESRLFGSALTRLEEAPLRLVETESHGSPWHELIHSDAFSQALDKVPSLKDAYTKITLNLPAVGRKSSNLENTKPDTSAGTSDDE